MTFMTGYQRLRCPKGHVFMQFVSYRGQRVECPHCATNTNVEYRSTTSQEVPSTVIINTYVNQDSNSDSCSSSSSSDSGSCE